MGNGMIIMIFVDFNMVLEKIIQRENMRKLFREPEFPLTFCYAIQLTSG